MTLKDNSDDVLSMDTRKEDIHPIEISQDPEHPEIITINGVNYHEGVFHFLANPRNDELYQFKREKDSPEVTLHTIKLNDAVNELLGFQARSLMASEARCMALAKERDLAHGIANKYINKCKILVGQITETKEAMRLNTTDEPEKETAKDDG